MKYYILLILLIFISCNKNDDEQLINNIENTLPGTWQVVKLNNIASDSLNFQDAYFEAGSYLENFGTITIPDFNLEYDDDNFISISSISCEFTFGEFSYPFFFTNQTIFKKGNIFQCQFQPDNSIGISGENQEIEEIIDNFKIFHKFYKIDIISNNSINIISREGENDIIMNLVRF